MGTDIYLKWDGQTEEERKRQITGWSIDAGGAGYLRASIGMRLENRFLRFVFPEEMWDGEERRFEFTEGKYERLQKGAYIYLVCVMTGKDEIEKMLPMNATEKMGQVLMKVFGKTGGKIVVPRNDSLRSAVMWLESLYKFFELGMKLEEDGKRPRVRISW